MYFLCICNVHMFVISLDALKRSTTMNYNIAFIHCFKPQFICLVRLIRQTKRFCLDFFFGMNKSRIGKEFNCGTKKQENHRFNNFVLNLFKFMKIYSMFRHGDFFPNDSSHSFKRINLKTYQVPNIRYS